MYELHVPGIVWFIQYYKSIGMVINIINIFINDERQLKRNSNSIYEQFTIIYSVRTLIAGRNLPVSVSNRLLEDFRQLERS